MTQVTQRKPPGFSSQGSGDICPEDSRGQIERKKDGGEKRNDVEIKVSRFEGPARNFFLKQSRLLLARCSPMLRRTGGHLSAI